MKSRFNGTNIWSVQDVISTSRDTGIIVLFLDFRKAFDTVNHLFLVTLLAHIGFPSEYVAWISLLHAKAESAVRHKNWLMRKFPLLQGVRQGCPLSCHLFNLVGQVLIYSLRDSSYFEWWHFMNDPCSLYADDTAIFLSDITQLAVILKYIEYIGTFTSLCLNMDKTIAFDLNASNKIKQVGVEVGSTPVKYLGAYLGLGDLKKLNFDSLLKKAKAIAARWNKHSLTLRCSYPCC